MTDGIVSSPAELLLPPPLRAAIRRFDQWNAGQLQIEQKATAIAAPLYHYTDARGFEGVVKSGDIWFTDHRHLNDPSELIHGIEMAHKAARMIGDNADGRVRLFLELFADMFRRDNFEATLQFFIASFTRERDDLAQWRAYADNARGFAIGFAPSMFHVVDKAPPDRLPEFVGPVRYSDNDVIARQEAALRTAAELFLETANAETELMRDRAIGLPFMQEFSRSMIASPLIWNCLTSKHFGYAHEREVRLVIMGQPAILSPRVKRRPRGEEAVPFIAQPMGLREPGLIAEIVVGPAAPAGAEENARNLLGALGLGDQIPVRRSSLPYRAL